MKKRIFTGFFILLALIVALFFRSQTIYAFDIVIMAIAVVSCLEISKALNANGKHNNTVLVSLYPIILYLGIFIGILNSYPYYFFILYYPISIVGIFIINLLVAIVFKTKSNDSTATNLISRAYQKAINSIYILIYPALLFVPIFFLNNIASFNGVFFNYVGNGINIFSLFILLSLFVTTMFSDTFAYVTGSIIKGPKLCPKISPKKTIAGAVGGLVFSVIGILILFLIFNTNTEFNTFYMEINASVWHILILGIIGSVISQVGDIYASYFKRKHNIKDFGSFLPGHGGALDRVDGLIFNGVFIFILTLSMLL